VIEIKQTKNNVSYNKQQNTIDMQRYQAVTGMQLTKQAVNNNALTLQKQ